MTSGATHAEVRAWEKHTVAMDAAKAVYVMEITPAYIQRKADREAADAAAHEMYEETGDAKTAEKWCKATRSQIHKDYNTAVAPARARLTHCCKSWLAGQATWQRRPTRSACTCLGVGAN